VSKQTILLGVAALEFSLRPSPCDAVATKPVLQAEQHPGTSTPPRPRSPAAAHLAPVKKARVIALIHMGAFPL
jgi:hypothetical protein